MKIIFYKDWGQIGCKSCEGKTKDEMMEWLHSNHNINSIKRVIFIK